MELLFVALGGALLGLAARYAVPGRATHGVVLIPAIGTAVAAVVWVALTWLGWPWDGGWIWVASLAAAGIVSALSAFLLGPSRERHDAELFERLARPGAGAKA
ncbi:hypothetical protein M3147_02885 [Agromyces mediolanus]|uniref:hypothetical protein n=1 Tax=Agromyces mediolanus TaxID=41986 RepID=UPI00203E6FBB|nr:hypothetical protein [Agromyces mediolanus]MCM3656191.1 hypothetical protein [Agromyces mediolanus]